MLKRSMFESVRVKAVRRNVAVTEIGHVVLGVTDFDGAVERYTEDLRVWVSGLGSGEAYLKLPGEQDAHCLVLRQADRAGPSLPLDDAFPPTRRPHARRRAEAMP